jgi:hypothetical protein
MTPGKKAGRRFHFSSLRNGHKCRRQIRRRKSQVGGDPACRLGGRLTVARQFVISTRFTRSLLRTKTGNKYTPEMRKLQMECLHFPDRIRVFTSSGTGNGNRRGQEMGTVRDRKWESSGTGNGNRRGRGMETVRDRKWESSGTGNGNRTRMHTCIRAYAQCIRASFS